MSEKEMFKKYYSRLRTEGILKAVLIGLVAGLAVSAIPAVILLSANWFNWLYHNDVAVVLSMVVLVTLLIAAAVTTIVAVPVYLKWFKPTANAVATRVDKLGLEERLVTMMELEGDESYIAMLQREDAKMKAQTVATKQVRFSFAKVFVLPLVLTAVFFSVSVGAMVGSALSVDDRLDWNEPRVYCEYCCECEYDESICVCVCDDFVTVNYRILLDQGALVGGVIIGDNAQRVRIGEDASRVIAVADPWFRFERWSDWEFQYRPVYDPYDEYAEPEWVRVPFPLLERAYRQDFEVMENINVYAIFVRVNEPPLGGRGPGEEPPDPDPDGEPPVCECCICEYPLEPWGDYCECECECPEVEIPGVLPPDGNHNWNDINYVNDGQTHIRHIMEQYYREAMEILSAGGDICPVRRAIIEAFFGIILIGA